MLLIKIKPVYIIIYLLYIYSFILFRQMMLFRKMKPLTLLNERAYWCVYLFNFYVWSKITPKSEQNSNQKCLH